jgi:hypothetical protein
MKCLTVPECEAWLQSYGLLEKANELPSNSKMESLRINIPDQVFHKQEIAKEIVQLAGKWDEALIWIIDWPFYRPEQMAVLTEMRRANLENRRLIDARGHLFRSDEKELASGFVALNLFYQWDFKFLAHPMQSAVLSYTHDDVMEIFFENKIDGERVKSRLKELGIKFIE